MNPDILLKDVFCKCCTPPFNASDFLIVELGTDVSSGKWGDVTVEQCKACYTYWIKYLYENEAFSKSGRWFRAVLADNWRYSISSESVIAYLEQLDWYYYGGSYYETAGKKGKGTLNF
jgi:hypothetical protein